MIELKTRLTRFNVLSFGMGEFGRAMLQTLLSTFMLFYLVNFGGIKASIVGIIILIARFWDAVNDPIMGYIVDNTETKMGKARPYILYCTLPAVLLTFMLFAVPSGFSLTAKVIWVSIGYIIGGTFLTAIDVPYNTLMSRITENSLERVSLARSKMVLNIIGFIFPIIVVNAYTVNAENQGLAYTQIVAILSLIIILSKFWVFIGTKEVVKIKKKKLQFKEGLNYLRKNKSWLKLFSIAMLYMVQYTIFMGVLLFYLTSHFKKPELLTTVMILVLVGTLFAGSIGKILTKKIGKRNVMISGLLLSVFGLLIRIVTGDQSTMIFTVSSLIYGIGVALYMISHFPMVADTIDYYEVKKGKRIESLSYAGISFAVKAGSGIATAILGFMLDYAGYIEGVIEQTPKVIDTMFYASSIIPAGVMILMAIIGFTYKIENEMPEVSKELEAIRTSENVS